MVAIYYWIHKPLTPELARAVGGAFADLLSVAAMTAVAGGVGRRLVTLLLPGWSDALSRTERIAAEALLGLGVVGVLIFGVGLLWLHTVSVGVLLFVLAALSLRPLLAGWAMFLAGRAPSNFLNLVAHC